jgi:hypothetical protein
MPPLDPTPPDPPLLTTLPNFHSILHTSRRAPQLFYFILGEITLYPLNYSHICTFTSKVSNVTLNPPKLSNCDNLITLTFFFSQNVLITYFIFFKKNNPKTKTKKPKKKKKEEEIYWGAPIIFLFLFFGFLFFFFLNKIKYVMGHFGKKKEGQSG